MKFTDPKATTIENITTPSNDDHSSTSVNTKSHDSLRHENNNDNSHDNIFCSFMYGSPNDISLSVNMNVNCNNSNILSSLNQSSHVDVLRCSYDTKVIPLLGTLRKPKLCMLHNISN